MSEVQTQVKNLQIGVSQNTNIFSKSDIFF